MGKFSLLNTYFDCSLTFLSFPVWLVEKGKSSAIGASKPLTRHILGFCTLKLATN
jgi:hypothetical protein